jgi:flagellin
MERLSTGVRVNSAKDDAAGLAIGQSMTAQIRGLNQAVRNINDGINLIQTADGGLNSISQLLQRMRELAVQASNGSYSDTQRTYLEQENAALQTQINNIIYATTWNGQNLLDGTFTDQILQVGSNAEVSMAVAIPAVTTGGSSITTYSATAASATVGSTALAAGDLTVNSVAIGAASSSSAKDLAAAINLQTSSTNVTAIARATASTAVALVTPSSPISTVDLGSYGALMSPVQVDGNHWYYYWDVNGDGSPTATNQGNDTVTHNQLDSIFNKDADGNLGVTGNTTDSFRFGTLNGIELALPTLGISTTPLGYVDLNALSNPVYPDGTSVGTLQHQGSTASNGTYDDYLAISDAYNGTFIGSIPGDISNVADFPSGWKGYDDYWSATPANDGQLPSNQGHIAVVLGHGRYKAMADTNSAYVALEVINPSFFDIINSGDIQINDTSIGAIESASTADERQTQMLTAINAQSTTTGVSATVDANTGGVTLTASDGRNIEVSTLTSASISNSVIGIDLNGTPSGTRTITTFCSGVDLSSTNSSGITITASGGAEAATGLSSQTIYPTATTTITSTIDISTAPGASSAIYFIDSILDSVNSTRSSIGSYINRLIYAADNVTNISSNLTASRSTIMDTDYAIESTNLAKSQITQQAATAVLAQANQQPQSVLALLKNL